VREMKITRERVDQILEIMYETFGIGDEDSFRSSYSGRGMYGSDCVGFVVPPGRQAALGAAIARAFADVDDESEEYGMDVRMLTRACTDNMAFDVIVYFPGVQLQEEGNKDA
jgi:hypothetical protein